MAANNVLAGNVSFFGSATAGFSGGIGVGAVTTDAGGCAGAAAAAGGVVSGGALATGGGAVTGGSAGCAIVGGLGETSAGATFAAGAGAAGVTFAAGALAAGGIGDCTIG